MDKERFAYYKTHIETMDTEHWEILHTLDLVNNALHTQDLLLLKSLAAEMNVLLHKHYSNEERYMHSVKYLYIKAHAAEHIILKEEMDNIVKSITSMYYINKITGDWLINKLNVLLIGHIDEHDLQYADFVRINK